MPITMTPSEFQLKHSRRLKAALEDMRTGVERVTQAPGAKAAQSADKMRSKLMEALDSGKWARRVGSVTLDQWKTSMTQKGIPRVSAGIDGAAQKTTEFATQLFEHENRVLEEVNRMPNVTLEDSITRATSWIRRMSEFTRR